MSPADTPSVLQRGHRSTRGTVATVRQVSVDFT